MILDDRAAAHPLQAIMQGDPGPRDRGGSCAAIGLQNIAVKRDLAFAQGLKIGDRAQTAADQALDFVGSPGLLAGSDFAPRPRMCRARSMAYSAVIQPRPDAQPGWRLVFERSRAQHMGLPEFDEAGAFA